MSAENETDSPVSPPCQPDLPSSEHVFTAYSGHDMMDDDGCEFMEALEPPPNGVRSSPESPVPRSNPASPDEQSPPESPDADEGQVTDDDEQMEYQNYMPAEDNPQSPDVAVSATHSDAEANENQADEDEKARLGKLKDMRFKGPKSSKRSGAPTRRTVRSFLDEKGAENLDVTTFAGRPAKSERDEHGYRDERERERPERKKKKKKHDRDSGERAERRAERAEKERAAAAAAIAENTEVAVNAAFTEARPHLYNPYTLSAKVNALLTKVEEAQDYEPCQEAEDEIRALLLEAVLLDAELEETHEKRQNLLKEMEEMAEKEKENIKKMHAELPAHLQNVIKMDGDNIVITDGPNGASVPALFPPMPSMLNEGAAPFAGFPSSNGLFSWLLNGTRTPTYNDDDFIDDFKEDLTARAITSPSIDQMSWSHTTFNALIPSTQDSADNTGEPLPSYIQENFGFSIHFALPPLNAFTDTDEDPTQSYQLPPNPGAPGVPDVSKTITSMLTNMVKNNPAVKQEFSHNFDSPSQQQGVAPNSIVGVSSPRRSEPRPNPPSLMSIPTFDPFSHDSPRLSGRTRAIRPAGHADSPR